MFVECGCSTIAGYFAVVEILLFLIIVHKWDLK